MIDITNNEDEKDSFITKVYLKDDANRFVKCYASGRSEEVDFSIEELNKTFTQMEEQFLKYRESFVENSFKQMKRATINKLLEALVAIAGLYFTCNIEIPNILKVIIATILVVGSICYQRNQSEIEKDNEFNLRVVAIADEFLAHKEEFMIKVKNPISGEDENWYLLTLSDIETLYSPNLVSKLAKGLTPEVKDEESRMTSEVLQKRMKLS